MISTWRVDKFCHSQGRNAFTLTEMLLVVAIVAMLVSLAVPVFARKGTGSTVSQANDFATLCGRCRDLTRADSASRRVSVQQRGGAFSARIFKRSDGGWIAENEAPLLLDNIAFFYLNDISSVAAVGSGADFDITFTAADFPQDMCVRFGSQTNGVSVIVSAPSAAISLVNNDMLAERIKKLKQIDIYWQSNF